MLALSIDFIKEQGITMGLIIKSMRNKQRESLCIIVFVFCRQNQVL